MGAWGEKAFENDDAMDWVYELERTRNASLVIETLEGVGGGEEYLDASVGSAALAAAEVVAALKGDPEPELPDEVKTWVRESGIEADRRMLDLALRAVARVGRNPASELRELWEESGDASEWHAAVEGLSARLNL